MLASSVLTCTCSDRPVAICAKLSGPVPRITPDGPGRLTAEPADEIAFVYDQDQLRTFELRLAPADLARLDADPTKEEYVRGALVFDGVKHGPVGIRYKGSVGAWVRCTADSTEDDPLNVGGAKTCPKLNLNLVFDWA